MLLTLVQVELLYKSTTNPFVIQCAIFQGPNWGTSIMHHKLYFLAALSILVASCEQKTEVADSELVTPIQTSLPADTIADDAEVEATDNRISNEPYRAFIAYHSEPDSVSEDWSWFYSELSEVLTPHGILITEARPEDYSSVTISEHGETLDITPYMQNEYNGYVVVEEGKAPKYVEYNQPFNVLEVLRNYYTITDL